jgi:hypothetical protein
MTTKYDLTLNKIIKYEIYDLITVSEEQIEFIRSFKEKYRDLKDNLETIKSDFFPLMISE